MKRKSKKFSRPQNPLNKLSLFQKMTLSSQESVLYQLKTHPQ